MRRMIWALPIIMIASYAHAADAPAKPALPESCPLKNTATLTITLNESGADVVALRKNFDSDVDDAQKFADAMKLEKFEVQSQNYSIRPHFNREDFLMRRNRTDADAKDNAQYTLSGNVVFTVVPGDKGADIMALMVKKGYQATLNVNANRFNCPPPGLPGILPSLLQH